MKIDNTTFIEMVKAASMAPSSDNMQPWNFFNRGNYIEVKCVVERLLKIDVMDMFSWISIGASIENIVQYSKKIGLKAEIEYNPDDLYRDWVARISFVKGEPVNSLADYIPLRTTNRSPFSKEVLDSYTLDKLGSSLDGIESGFHYTTSGEDLKKISSIDTVFSSILLEHEPLFDGFFDTLLFTKKEIESIRFGMDIKSLDIPFIFAFIAKRLKGLKINRIISRLGMGHTVADILSSRLKSSGGILLITAKEQSPLGYIKAGRAMEVLWLKITSLGLSAHPYGVIPQYLTMAEIKPSTFLDNHIPLIKNYKKPFFQLFPDAADEFPAVMLRVGFTKKISKRTTVRLKPEQITG